MTTIGKNPVSDFLSNAFGKFDKDGSGKLNSDEFSSFFEVLRPGTAEDSDIGSPEGYRAHVDTNRDGEVSEDEMNSTSVLMPADLMSGPASDFSKMITYLKAEETKQAALAADILSADDDK